jgi:hypothetical protein
MGVWWWWYGFVVGLSTLATRPATLADEHVLAFIHM